MSDIEEIELTSKGLHILLVMTREPDAYTDRTKALVKALHGAEPCSSSRWTVHMTEQDVTTAVFLFNGYFLNRPTERNRIVNHLSRDYSTFERAFRDFTKGESL